MQVMAAGVARIRRPRGNAMELAFPLALRAMSVRAVRRVPLPPEPVQTRRVVRELTHEVHERVRGLGTVSELRRVAVDLVHLPTVSGYVPTVKGYLPLPVALQLAGPGPRR